MGDEGESDSKAYSKRVAERARQLAALGGRNPTLFGISVMFVVAWIILLFE